MSVPYIISKYEPVSCCSVHMSRLMPSRRIDPIFALSVGVAAACVRINREEKEKSKTTQETIESLRRRWALVFEKRDAAKVESTGDG